MVRCTPVVHNTPPTEELVGGMVLDSPVNLSIGEVVEPLEQKGTEVDTQLEFASKPPFPLGRGALQIGEYHIGEGLPGDDLGQLDQWMGGRDVDGHGLHTAGGVESRETDAHGEAAFSVACGRVLLASDHEGIIVFNQLQPLTLQSVRFYAAMLSGLRLISCPFCFCLEKRCSTSRLCPRTSKANSVRARV